MSKMGQRDIRRLLITGAMSVVRRAVIRGANDPGCERYGACQTFAAQAADGYGGGAGQQDGEDDLGGRSIILGFGFGKRAGCGAVRVLKRPARFVGCQVAKRGMRPDVVVVIAPQSQFLAGIRKAVSYARKLVTA